MSRRYLTLAVVALASLVVSACSSSPTAPQNGLRAPGASNADIITTTTTTTDTTARSGFSGSNS